MKKELCRSDHSWANALCNSIEKDVKKLNKWQRIAAFSYRFPVLSFLIYWRSQRNIARKLNKLKRAFNLKNFNNLNNPCKNV